MKTNIASFFTLGVAVALLAFVGCSKGPSSVPVSGVVTLDGKPVTGLTVVFFPEPTKENSSPGPYSSGVTDATGKYVLKNRYGKDGAVVWQHRVSLEFEDIDEEALSEAQNYAAEAKSSGESSLNTEAKRLAAEAKAQLAKHPKIPKKYLDGPGQFLIDVPPGGTDSANLEMVSK